MSMNLSILLPFHVFDEIKNVKLIVMETSEGAFGILPQRVDCVAALVPGILLYQTDSEHYIAIDEGVMIKTGLHVVVSVRNAVRGASLAALQLTVEEKFKQIAVSEQNMRSVMAQMESGFMLNLEKFRTH